MIAPMEKLLVAGARRQARELLVELQKAGVVHLETLRPAELAEYKLSSEEAANLRRWEHVASGSEHALAILGVEAGASSPFTGTLADAEAILKPWANRAELLGKERAALEEELQTVHLFGQAANTLAGLCHGLDQSGRHAIIPFLVGKQEELEPAEKALQAALPQAFLLDSCPLQNQWAAVVVVRKEGLEAARSALSRLGLAELRFPGAYGSMPLSKAADRMNERAKIAPEELVGIREELSKLGTESRQTLLGLWTRAKDEALRYKSLSELAAGTYGYALMGFVPIKAKPRVEEALARLKESIVYAFEPIDEHHEGHQVPVTLDNPGWAQPFELLHGFLNTPKYGGYDPTLTIATFFPFFFGMVVGDVGVALLFAWAAWFLGKNARQGKVLEISFLGAKLGPVIQRNLSHILWWLVFWGMVFGILYGELFGTLGERLHLFYDPNHAEGAVKGLVPILINRLDFARTSGLLMLVSLGFGVLHVLYAFAIRAYQGLKHRHQSHFWEGFGYLAGAAGLISFAFKFMSKNQNPVFDWVALIGLGLFVFSALQARMPLMFAELPGKGGQILSYIRIYAVGVAGAVLSDLANQVGFGLAAALGPVGWVIGALAGFLIMVFVLALTTLGHVLQPIRLLWIEFATNLGFYDESGRPYRPFKSVGSNLKG